MKTYPRSQRVADLIHQELASALLREVKDPRLTGVSLTGVELSHDLARARVFYTLSDEGNQDDVNQALEKATRFLRHRLSQAIDMRYTPNIYFEFDSVMAHADRVSHLLRDVVAE